MSVDDPFSVVRGEVQKSLNTSRGLYQRWCELLQESNVSSAEEFDWTTNELRNSLRSIEWDLEDLEETIGIVEANPKKFKITGAELCERKNFVEQTRSSLKEMRDHISSPRAQAFAERKNREALGVSQPMGWDHFSRLDEEILSGDSRYIEDQQAQQQLILDEQDADLELVSGSIRVLKNMSGRIGDELDEQAVMLDDFSHEMDNTQNRMDSVLKRLAKVSHMTSDRRQWCAIIVLVVALLILLIVLFSHNT
ncbi:PREDICTED: syntaxin-10 isoform X2 [Nanorana parkeri]|uniref:syntaxin-10 isoform X2 n=1 Tax=Nanorana parkeri TaxID=125878 RepID=UPI000854C0C8|nr:PREDICTED: syntaxin-10 isoform X2 [Nanorana parkeri]